MNNDPFSFQAVELIELARAVDATGRVIHLGSFRLGNGDCRAGMLSRRSLLFRPIASRLCMDSETTRRDFAALRAALYSRATAEFRVERIPVPALLPPLPWLPPQDASAGGTIACFEGSLQFDAATETNTRAFEGLGRRFLVTAIPSVTGQFLCLLERSVDANDATDAAAQFGHLCRPADLQAAFDQIATYARSVGVPSASFT